MKTRTKAMGFLLLIIASACIALVAARPTEPTYKGQTLSFWVERYSHLDITGFEDIEAREALEAMSTNALPFLRGWATYNPPTWPGRLPWAPVRGTMYRLLGIGSKIRRSDAAIFAFSALRTNAQIVVPELTRLLKAHPMAMQALGRLGAPGLPPLLNAWSNSADQNERWRIQYTIVFNLAPDVRNTNLVPLLLATLSQNRPQAQFVGVAASNALFQIAPEIATNPPPQ